MHRTRCIDAIVRSASVHSIGMHVDCCIVMHRARCMRADRSSAFYSIVVHPARCDRAFCMHVRCNATREIDHDTCMQLGAMQQWNRSAVMRLNRCAVMRVKLWERFGIVRQARGVDILSELFVGVCPEEPYLENHYRLRARHC